MIPKKKETVMRSFNKGSAHLDSVQLPLEYLDFSGGMAFRNGALIVAIIGSSPNLRHLDISGNKFADTIIGALAHTCHKLEYLDICACTFATETSIRNAIRSCPNLQYLNLSYCKITNVTIEEIARHLKFLVLEGCDDI
jgi:Leucine-rich repeat (LRR) protein